MEVLQIVDQIAPLVGLGIQTLAAALQGYQTFKRSNVEVFFRLLLADARKSEQGLKRIGQDGDLQRLFFSIIDRVASEERKEKIRNWKNMLVHLATDFSGEEFKDTYTRILDSLSVLDLTILHQAYAIRVERQKFKEQVVKTLSERGIEPPLIAQSMQRLAANGLLDGFQDKVTIRVGSQIPVFDNLNYYYDTNEFGRKFLQMISDDEIK